MTEIDQSKALLGLTADIVSAHVKNNQVPMAALPALIEQVFAALRGAGRAASPAPAPLRVEPERQMPVVSAKKSVFPDYIICLEDGRKLKTLKRHLRSTYNLTPEQYREKWGLAADYPMVAPNYAEHRSALAKQAGLGRKPGSAKPGIAPDVMPLPAARPAPAPSPLAARTPPPPAAHAAAPSIPAPPPEAILEHPRDTRPEHTAASVFAKFPRAQEPAAEAAPASPADKSKSTRKPFSKQLARGMRP
jgi:predicted transcriptional regulator